MPIRVRITTGTREDCRAAISLFKGIKAKYLLADRAYDTNLIVDQAISQGIQIVIPSKKNRIKKHQYNKALYPYRNRVENTFLDLKQWRGIATRYAKNSLYFLAAVQIGCMHLWSQKI